jgi:hypothetical protein
MKSFQDYYPEDLFTVTAVAVSTSMVTGLRHSGRAKKA